MNQRKAIISMARIVGIATLAVMLVTGPAFADGNSVSKKGKTRAAASYQILEDGNELKIKLRFKVRKDGRTGGGKGAMEFVLFDVDGNEVARRAWTLTVGADFSRPATTKNKNEMISFFGAKAKRLMEEGGAIAFRVEAKRDSNGIPNSLDEWKDVLGEALPIVLSGLAAGGQAEIGGWNLERF